MRVHRGDPLTEVFGRDIAGIIYRIIWQEQIKFVNKQYKNMILPNPFGVSAGVTLGDKSHAHHCFNFRCDVYHCYPIYKWNRSVNCTILPEHYWEIPELY